MERRIAITTAATVALTVLAGGTAVAANVGILGGQPASGLGETPSVTAVPTTTPEPEVRTIVVDETVPAPGRTGSSVASTPPPSSDDHGDEYEEEHAEERETEHEEERETEHEEEHEEEHELEGAHDDD